MKLISVLTIQGLKKDELALLSNLTGASKLIYSAPGEIAKDQFRIGVSDEIEHERFFYIGEDVKEHTGKLDTCLRFYKKYDFKQIEAPKKKAKA